MGENPPPTIVQGRQLNPEVGDTPEVGDGLLAWAASHPGPFTLAEALAATGRGQDRADEMRAAASLKAAGFGRAQVRAVGVRTWAYRRPAEVGDGVGGARGHNPEVGDREVGDTPPRLVTEVGDTRKPSGGAASGTAGGEVGDTTPRLVTEVGDTPAEVGDTEVGPGEPDEVEL